MYPSTPPTETFHGRRSTDFRRQLHPSKRQGGAALLIVLAFVVLLAGLMLAFFSRAVTQRAISEAYAKQVKVDMLARAAADTIVGDLKQEIIAGSIQSNPAPSVTIYTPLTPKNAVPSLSGTSGGLPFPPNLLKLSGSDPIFSVSGTSGQVSGPVRGISLPTATSPSLNGRSIRADRWNAPLLLESTPGSKFPKVTGSAPGLGSWALPSVDGTFTGPSWVLLARSGANPTVWSNDMIWSESNPATVIGRYAYAIYDEGGLLNMNVAGYPSGSTNGAANLVDMARKGSPALADLTQLPLASGSFLTQADVDKMVAWRNASVVASENSAKEKVTGSNYLLSIRRASHGFLTLNSTSDRAFISRKSLIKFLTGGNLSLSTADAQSALQYMGTFSRSLEQPSYIPPADRPMIVAPENISNPKPFQEINYRGGNDGYGGDDVLNPSFPDIRVATTFLRNDGTTAKAGEPLVLKKFALSRLAWLTCKGPSAPRKSSSDPDIQALKAAGLTEGWLEQGTDANIFKYFGLRWQATPLDPAKPQKEPGGFWIYDHAIASGGSAIIGNLRNSNTLSLSVLAANREADFFELLKATINAGSLGKAAAPGTTQTHDAGAYYQTKRDKVIDCHILQIAANIIDQYDPDGYPTRIAFFCPAIRPLVIRGCENLPYLYRLRTTSVQLSDPASIPMPEPLAAGDLSKEITNDLSSYAGDLFRPGNMVLLANPELWNPHAQNSSQGEPKPTTFRVFAETTDPSGTVVPSDAEMKYTRAAVGNMGIARSQISPAGPITLKTFSKIVLSGSSVNETASTKANTHRFALRPGSTAIPYYASTLDVNGTSGNIELAGSELLFDCSDSSLFQEPTLLSEKDFPAGTALRAGPNNVISSGIYPGYNGALTDRVTGKDFVGFYLGEYPLRWIIVEGSKVYLDTIQKAGVDKANLTVRLQCQDAIGQWITYNERYYRNIGGTYDWVTFKNNIAPKTQVNTRWNAFDPRSERWGNPVTRGGDLLTSSYSEGSQNTERPLAALGNQYRATRNVPGYPTDFTAAADSISNQIGWFGGPFSSSATYLRLGDFTQNIPVSGQQYYADADDIVRRATGAYASTSDVAGLPMATANSNSRPIILNRPFRSVSELGYVFKDTPWKNLDFFTPETGDAALLDLFCINEPQSVMTAGRINLNTRQAPVLKAILSQTLKDELDTTALDSIRGDLDTIANAIIARTSNSTISRGPFTNLSDLAGRLVGRNVSGGGSEAYMSTDRRGIKWLYSGLGADLASNNAFVNEADKKIKRRAESAIRALSDSGQTRVWNLLIDLVAQVGKYPPGSSLTQFIVQGEKRYWYHIAIDRLTGEVLDCSVESVSE
jgi:hypothetical protein